MIILALLIIGASYLCYYLAFYVSKRKHNPVSIVNDPMFDPYRDIMRKWLEETLAMPHTEMCITSFDGLKLYGKYYECNPDAPIEILVHGYRGTAERDLGGGVQRCFALGRNTLIISQRGSGKSEGKTISFGINEAKDCRAWIDHLIRTKGENVTIYLGGISMGATTVLIAAGDETLPKNVVGVVADSGFTSAKEIICDVIRGMRLPPKLCFPFVRLGARLFGHFSISETSAREATSKIRIPVLFFHGADDRFVPCSMCHQLYDACTAKKQLVIVPGAGHGMGYLLDTEGYINAIRNFFDS